MSERLRRVDEAVKEVLSEGIGDLKDPRIGFVTITGVRTSADLRQARVFVSVLGSKQKRERSLEGLAAAHGVLQARPSDRKSTRLNSSHQIISYAVFCLKKKNKTQT